MSRKLLAFLITELQTVRLICAKCRCVTEMDVSKLMGLSFQCPGCKAAFPDAQIVGLGKSIAALKEYTAMMEVEFVIPDDSK